VCPSIGVDGVLCQPAADALYDTHEIFVLQIDGGQIDEARERCRKLLQLDPFNVSGRQAWVGFLLQQGKQAEARREFDIIRRLRPPDLAQREEWFQQQLK
jgi:DNA-binding SARP family transcriptional activator